MCYPEPDRIRREPQLDPPQTPLQQYIQWSKYHWTLWHDFKEVIQQGQYGAYYQFLLEELPLGPYWSDVKFYYGQVHEDGLGTSDSKEETGSETGYQIPP